MLGQGIGEKTMSYPDGSLQKYFHNESWWEKTKEKQLAPGRLIWAFVPHVDIIPKSLIPTGRAEDEETNHSKASYEIADLASLKRMLFLPLSCLTIQMSAILSIGQKKDRHCLSRMASLKYQKNYAQT